MTKDRDNEVDRNYKPFDDVEDSRGKLQEYMAKHSGGCLIAFFQLPILLLKKIL